MRILDIQNLQLCHNNFYISINDLHLENDVWYIETSINLYFNFSDKVFINRAYSNTRLLNTVGARSRCTNNAVSQHQFYTPSN